MRYALILLLVATAAFGQVAEKITVNVVEVPVTVIGKNGEPVRGLTAKNFQLTDDGRRREISGFEAIDLAAQKNLTAISRIPPAARRSFVLLFDLSYSSPTSVTRARKAARDFITNMVQPTDRLAVATIDVTRGFRLVTGFTSDRVLVAEAIDDHETFRGYDPLQIAGPAIMDRPVLGQSILPGGDLGEVSPDASPAELRQAARKAAHDQANAEQEAYARMTERDHQAFQADKVEKQIDLLGGLAHALRGVSGRKFVVFLSDGFDSRTVQGSEVRNSTEAEDLRQAREKGEIWKFDNDKRFGNATTMAFYQEMSELFRRSDVVLHAIDTRGVRVNVDARAGVTQQSNESLFLLANATGGTVFSNTNDLASGFSDLLRQEEVVYVLAFSVPTSEPGRFHPIKVKLVDVPGARVVHRSGYYEAGAESEAEQNLRVGQILINDIPRNGLRLTTLPVAFRGEEGEIAQVPVVVDVSGEDIVAAADDQIVVVDVFVYAFGADGRVRGSTVQRLQLDMFRVQDKLAAGGLKYLATLELPPGAYAIKTLVRLPELDRDGFARAELTVPAASELAMTQPIFFDDPARWVLVKGKGTRAYPFAAGEEEFIPSATLSAAGAWPRQFAVFVQNASPEEVSFETSSPATLLARAPGLGGTAAVFRVDQAPKTADLAVTVTAKSGSRKSAVPVQ